MMQCAFVCGACNDGVLCAYFSQCRLNAKTCPPEPPLLPVWELNLRLLHGWKWWLWRSKRIAPFAVCVSGRGECRGWTFCWSVLQLSAPSRQVFFEGDAWLLLHDMHGIAQQKVA